MERSRITVAETELDLYRMDTLVVGSGAAGLNAADCLRRFGVEDVALLTEGMDMGTSRNTGSDKQTYYKLNLSGAVPDSVHAMAETLFSGGSMHGDIALVQAALSAVCFARLADGGVDFPSTLYGEYIGYRTDHDTTTRATSAGPLTSRQMTECLERAVRSRGIPILEPLQAIALITESDGDVRHVRGLLALDRSDRDRLRFALIQCGRIVYAAGGPAGLYADRVYPPSQTGATGIALEAGAPAANLTEWQYGIASTGFRWNLSGTYQQVLPHYYSTEPDGSDRRDFLDAYFTSDRARLTAQFLKGYQWPFDVRRLDADGSSLVDIAVYIERVQKGRKAYMDFRENPPGLDPPLHTGQVPEEVYTYLKNSGALGGTPIDRLRIMNPDAVALFASHGIDLAEQPLEIAVCAQHHNGGLAADIWWESELRGFFPVGEVNGSFGVFRPGGSALNETQTGSRRAAQRIAASGPARLAEPERFASLSEPVVRHRLGLIRAMLDAAPAGRRTPAEYRKALQQRMTAVAGPVRDLEGIREVLRTCRKERMDPAAGQTAETERQIPVALRNYDLLLAQTAVLEAIRDADRHGTGSRGGSLVARPDGTCRCAGYAFTPDSGSSLGTVQVTRIRDDNARPDDDLFDSAWVPVRPVPSEDIWFEKEWALHRKRRDAFCSGNKGGESC